MAFFFLFFWLSFSILFFFFLRFTTVCLGLILGRCFVDFVLDWVRALFIQISSNCHTGLVLELLSTSINRLNLDL